MSIQEMEDLKQQYLDEMKRLINSEYRDEIKIDELKQNFNGMSIEINKKEKLLQHKQWANLSTYPLKRFNLFCYDDDEDEDYTIVVTPSLSTEVPDNSLSMGDEHLDTIPSTKSDEFIKSNVENLIPIPSESEGIPDNMCNVPFHDNSLLEFETFCFDVEEIISGSTTNSANSLLEEFTDELDLITYPPNYDDNLQFDIDSDLKEIEFLLYQGKDSNLKDSIDQTDLANLDDYFVDPIPEVFTDEHTPDYSSPPLFDVYDDFLDVESDPDNFYDDPFDSKGEKIKEFKLLIDELDIPCDFLPYSEYDSFNS
nr:hypothetical protein [Tanacetum cinerariifolium]